MDTTEAAFEAEAELDEEALRNERDTQRGRRAAQLASGGIDASLSEETPLLADHDEQTLEEPDDFAGLPWYKRPSVFWVLGPYFLMTIAFGGAIAPKLNLILELVCHRYFKQQQRLDPTYVMIPVNFENGDNDQCRIPEVSSQVATFMLWASLLPGICSAITSPILGALSDRYGRKPVLVFTTVGAICFEIITIFAAKFPEQFPVNLLLVGFSIDGFTGSFIVSMAIANSYATDCTPPHLRNVTFGYFHGALFTGLAIGPILAGYVVKWSGQIVVVFYVLLGVHVFFALFVSICVPESLSKRRRDIAMAKYRERKSITTSDWFAPIRSFNLFEPLGILWPTGEGSSPALRRNLFVLAAVDTIVFGVAMGSMSVVIIYVNLMFNWKTFEMSRFISIMSTSRVFFLIGVLPLVTRLVRGSASTRMRTVKGSDKFDLSVIRIAVLFDTLGYLGYILARRGEVFILSGVVAAAGGIASPTLQSSLTKHVPNDRTGQLLGATGLLHSLARVVAPTIFNGIYALTVKVFPQTVFVCLAATFGFAFVISWFIRPHVYFDEDKAEETAQSVADGETPLPQQKDGGSVPILTAISAAFTAALVWIGLKSS
ncbi:Hypothetical protein R9X50_00596400 [Acrodontium crateriforme]|uniref:Major facilitator superfamily (MFS) profile domain-containing protein n=1 Tax=Acrodontium crateriforme TaxID=150365 RepID=A0AAQ3R9J1_9PEZI|nr:Hypothetical protein R9X50_00596400 [Acrodontium crateriforme]